MLTDKQKRFCTEYLKDLNATQAAIRAGYSPKYANRSADKTMKCEAVKKFIQEALDTINQTNIAQAEEVLEYLTKTMRGEVYEEKIMVDEETGEEVILRQPIKVSDRTKAAEYLAKHHKLLTDKVDLSGDMEVRVTLDGEIREWAR